MKTNGIAEILATGSFPNTYNFRVPQPFSHWKNAKAAARTHQNAGLHRGILTDHSKDSSDREKSRILPSSVKKTYRFT